MVETERGMHALAAIALSPQVKWGRSFAVTSLLLGAILGFLLPTCAAGDALDTIHQRSRLIWGADSEGGGPYVYPDPAHPRQRSGFEVELAEQIAARLGVSAEFSQAPWDNLPAVLETGEIDIVLNGYELTAARAGRMLHSRPYYVYELALLVRAADSRVNSWDELRQPQGDRPARVGVLGLSAAQQYLEKNFAGSVEPVLYEGNTDAMREVETAKLDATVVDSPVATFYRQRYAGLRQAGPLAGRGYYVIYCRQGEDRLRAALDEALGHLIESGDLKQIYDRYDLWSPAQNELARLGEQGDPALGIRATRMTGWQAILERGPLLVDAALVTVALACVSMSLAIVIGLFVAIGRLYGPAPLRWLLVCYVELLRGTPLMLQLYFIFFLLPEIGLHIEAPYAAVLGLSINYSAYEAEIYRAGMLSIPRGQMEAALALGMSPALALRRVIVPQTMRLVLPPVTNDFIAMFKDTSVCSVITVVELTKQYSIQRNDTGATVELAVLTAVLYLMMSIPLSQLTTQLEKRYRPKAA